MFPNPQDALPPPANPSLEQYRKLAKDLTRACRSSDPGAIAGWAGRWIASLGESIVPADHPRARQAMDRAAGQVSEFATRNLKDKCKLTEAQFVLARSHGFTSWRTFTEHLDRLAHADTEPAAYEAAADAIVSGSEAQLRRLLREHPGLIRARSTREHHATLLHYVSANGVEGYRQKTPPNIVAITEILLDAGAEVDAICDVYGGGCTTLGLVATSAHPRGAGVQLPLLQLLLDRGAELEKPGVGGNNQGAVMASLNNGCPEAAEFLAGKGATLDVEGAAGVGRVDVLRALLEPPDGSPSAVSAEEENAALRYAAFSGKLEVLRYLIGRGANLGGHSGDGQTAAHYAGIGGQLGAMQLLIAHGTPLEAKNEYGGTVLGQTLWSAGHGGKPEVFIPIIAALLEAGAVLRDRHVPVNPEVDAFLARHGSRPEPSWYWFGEGPREP